MKKFFGQIHPRIKSKDWLKRASEVEASQVLDYHSSFPIVIHKAKGARVVDCDNNHYIDMTGFFGVALVGHRNAAVTKALRTQIGRLLHGMGDVHPPDVKIKFLQEILKFMPSPDYKGVLSLNGCDAIECALKFAYAATKKEGVIAFEGSYHGLSLGALRVTHLPIFREQFSKMLDNKVYFIPFPTGEEIEVDRVIEIAETVIRNNNIGSVIIEPIQGRGGIRVPPPSFLKKLIGVTRLYGVVFIADEIYTGCGRTGSFLASQMMEVDPDCVCLGKSLGGGVPISVCLMKQWIADAVRSCNGEAVHTLTFMGHPLGAVAGLAVLREIKKRNLLVRAQSIGEYILKRAEEWKSKYPLVRDVRGIGAMIGLELLRKDNTPATEETQTIVTEALRKGVILITEGEFGNVISFTPPLVIEDKDLKYALNIVEDCIRQETIRSYG